MSKVFRSNQIILDQKKYEIKHKIVLPPEPEIEQEEELEEEVVEEVPEIDVEALIQERLDEVEADIRERMQMAEEDRQKMLSEAYDEAEKIRDDARQSGYDEGHSEGFKEGRKIAQGIIDDAVEIKNQVMERKKEIAKELEVEAVKLTIDTIELILNKHIEEDYEIILGIVKKSMEKCAYTEHLTLRVSNQDYNMALSLKNRVLALAESVDDIDIKADNSLRPGSCVLDTSAGSIDSSIWTQFENIKETYEILLRSD